MKEIESGFAATVGFFDGVHIGHIYLINQLKKIASERHLKSMVVTFPEHPRQILQSDYKLLLLSAPEDKIMRLEQSGVDVCFPLHFTAELSRMSAKCFMEQVLRDRLRVRCLLVGHDHHFGHEMGTTLADYINIGNQIGIEVIGADSLIYKNLPVSSSRIRRELVSGNLEDANTMLGYNYTINGVVVHGQQNGLKIGFPTANLGSYCESMQIPADGVYSALVNIDGEKRPAMINIGFRPTFAGNNNRTIEAHILDFHQDIYSHELSIEFIKYIRPERKFDSSEQLAQQLETDKETVRRSAK